MELAQLILIILCILRLGKCLDNGFLNPKFGNFESRFVPVVLDLRFEHSTSVFDHFDRENSQEYIAREGFAFDKIVEKYPLKHSFKLIYKANKISERVSRVIKYTQCSEITAVSLFLINGDFKRIEKINFQWVELKNLTVDISNYKNVDTAKYVVQHSSSHELMQDGQGLIKKFLDYKPVTVLLINKVIESNPDTRVVDVIWETDNTLLMAYEVSVCAYLSMKYMAILHKNYNFTLFVWDNRGKLWSNMTKHRFNMRELKFYFEDKNDLKSIEQLSKSYVVYLNHFKYVLDFNFDEKWRERFGPKLARNLQYNLLENSISIQFQSAIKITLESNIRNIKLVNDKMEGVARVVRSGLMCKRPFKYEFPEYYEFVNNIDMSIDSYVDPVQAFLESSSQAQDENVLEESDRKTYEESVERSTDSEDDATFVELDITIRKPKKGIVYRKSDKYIEYTCGLGFGITNIIESTHKDQISGSEGATVESSGTEEATISLDETLKSIDETLNFIDQTLSSIDKKLTVLENNENLRDKSTDLSYKIPKSLDEKYNFLQKHTRSLTEKYNSLFKKRDLPDKTTDNAPNTPDNTPNTMDKPSSSVDKPTNSMDKRLIWSTDNYDEPIVRVILFDGPGVKYLLGQKRNYKIHFFSCMDNWQEITGKTLNLGTLRMLDRRGDEIRYPNIITHFTKFQLYVKPYAACHRIMYKEQEIWASREKGVITELDFLILQILENKVNLYFRDKTVKRFKLSNGQISLISKGNSTYKQH